MKRKTKYRHEYTFHFWLENESRKPPTHIPTLVRELREWTKIEPASLNHLIFHQTTWDENHSPVQN